MIRGTSMMRGAMPKSMSKTPDTTSPMMTQTSRVLLVDDHAIIRAGLRLLLESEPGLKVVGEASNREEALTVAAREKPDLILLDLQLAQDNSLHFLPDLLATAAGTRVIVLTGMADPQMHRSAIALGAMGIVLKEH